MTMYGEFYWIVVSLTLHAIPVWDFQSILLFYLWPILWWIYSSIPFIFSLYLSLALTPFCTETTMFGEVYWIRVSLTLQTIHALEFQLILLLYLFYLVKWIYSSILSALLTLLNLYYQEIRQKCDGIQFWKVYIKRVKQINCRNTLLVHMYSNKLNRIMTVNLLFHDLRASWTNGTSSFAQKTEMYDLCLESHVQF